MIKQHTMLKCKEKVLEVKAQPENSDFVSLTREELGLILEAQDIIPFFSWKKENQDFIRIIGQYNKASWNCLRGNERFPFLLWTSLIVMISAFFLFQSFKIIFLFVSIIYLVVFIYYF